MRELIFQDDDNFYRLTPFGQKVYELLLQEDIEKIATKHIFGFKTIVNVAIDRLSIDAVAILIFVLLSMLVIISNWVGVAVIPFYAISARNNVVITILSVLLGTFTLVLFLKWQDLLSVDRASRLTLYYIISLNIILPSYSIYTHLTELGLRILGLVVTIILQTLALINFSSGISSTLKMSFSRSIILPLILHYASSSILYLYLTGI